MIEISLSRSKLQHCVDRKCYGLSVDSTALSQIMSNQRIANCIFIVASSRVGPVTSWVTSLLVMSPRLALRSQLYMSATRSYAHLRYPGKN